MFKAAKKREELKKKEKEDEDAEVKQKVTMSVVSRRIIAEKLKREKEGGERAEALNNKDEDSNLGKQNEEMNEAGESDLCIKDNKIKRKNKDMRTREEKMLSLCTFVPKIN